MATWVQRFVSFSDAVYGSASTAAQQNILATVICPNIPAEWTNAQKAEHVMRALIRELRGRRESVILRDSVSAAAVNASNQASSEIPDN